jgi:hypothetical protein
LRQNRLTARRQGKHREGRPRARASALPTGSWPRRRRRPSLDDLDELELEGQVLAGSGRSASRVVAVRRGRRPAASGRFLTSMALARRDLAPGRLQDALAPYADAGHNTMLLVMAYPRSPSGCRTFCSAGVVRVRLRSGRETWRSGAVACIYSGGCPSRGLEGDRLQQRAL